MSTKLATIENVEVPEISEVEHSRPTGTILDLNGSVINLPDLSRAIELPVDLMSDYWTPEGVGEFKRVIFDRLDIAEALVKDDSTGLETMVTLQCAYFLEQLENKDIKPVRNASKRLVGALVAAQVKRGTALKITYMGKKKNSTNSKQSDSWSIRPLRIEI